MKYLITIIFILTFQFGFSQDGRSLILVHNYANKATIDGITNPTEGNIAYNIDDKNIYVFDGINWILSSNSNWSVTGNTGLSSVNFLGHTDDVVMEIRSDDIPILQFGRRGTLGLDTTGDPDSDADYEDGTQPLVYINGDGATSALQFTAASAQYPPLFFSTPGGSFRLKGSSAGSDLFEIGSVGSANNGALEFIIGDDGSEPMTFKRYHFSNQMLTEMFRVQGSTNGGAGTEPNIKTRFGININQARVAIDPTYQTADAGNMANSTLQLEGSLSKSLLRTAVDIELTEDHYSVIVTDATAEVTLPTITAGDVNTNLLGREYIIKNTTNTDVTISSYRDNSDTDTITIPANNILKVQSDGTYWNQMNNYTSFEAICLTEPTFSTEADATDFGIADFDDTAGGGGGNYELDFDNDTGGTINELQILISDVPYSGFSIDDITLFQPGPDTDLSGVTSVISSTTCDGTDGNYDHLITISSMTFLDNPNYDIIIEFTITGPDGTDDDDALTFYIN